MTNRETAILLALALLVLYLASRRAGVVTATITGATVAPGVDVEQGDGEIDFDDLFGDEYP